MTASPPSDLFDQETWRQLRELLEGNDTSFLDNLLRNYLTTAVANLETIRNCSDNKTRRRAAHTLCGSSLSLVGEFLLVNVPSKN